MTEYAPEVYTSWGNYVKERELEQEEHHTIATKADIHRLEDIIENHRDSFTTVWDDHEKRVQELNNSLHSWSVRIKHIEEWKQQYDSLPSIAMITNLQKEYKFIDKKVWEEIKENLAASHTSIIPEYKHSRLGYIIGLIKKVDPEWCPND